MSAIVDKDAINLIFHIPVYDEDQLYNFYGIDPMHIFQNNKTYVPQIDAKYIAISKTDLSYTLVTNDEYTQCVIQKGKCTIKNLIRPMTERVHCVISTYTSKEMKCPVTETKLVPTAQMILTDNTTILSVPEPTKL